MTKPFVPHRPETYVQARITSREAVLLDRLRRSDFGKFVVHKHQGVIVRVEITDSYLIEENENFDLQ